MTTELPNLEAGEAAAAKVATAPRVTLDMLNARVTHEYFANAATALSGSEHDKAHPDLGTMTICVLILDNGFKLLGQSSAASPENFDAELGKKAARDDALRQLWPMEGYLLRERLWLAEQDRLIEAYKLASRQRTQQEDGDA